jgi:hypothetical protein
MYGRAIGIVTKPIFRKSFSHKEDRLNFFEQLKTPKVILVDTGRLGDATTAFGRFFIAKLHQAMLKRRAARDGSLTKPGIFLYVDEAADYIADEPLIAKMIDTVRKDGLGMTFATQRDKHIREDVLDALRQVYTQSRPHRPTVSVTFDPTEPPDPPREPREVFMEKIELEELGPMTEAQFLQNRERMKAKFGPLPNTAEAPAEEAPATIEEAPADSDDSDDTDAKPWPPQKPC